MGCQRSSWCLQARRILKCTWRTRVLLTSSSTPLSIMHTRLPPMPSLPVFLWYQSLSLPPLSLSSSSIFDLSTHAPTTFYARTCSRARAHTHTHTHTYAYTHTQTGDSSGHADGIENSSLHHLGRSRVPRSLFLPAAPSRPFFFPIPLPQVPQIPSVSADVHVRG